MTQISFTIVPMTEWWHLEHSIKLARDCLPEHTTHIRDELTDPEASYYVALVNGGVKGFAGYKAAGHNRSAVFDFVWNLVHPDYRRQGIGRALTEQRIEDIRVKNGKLIILSTPVPKVYLPYGFETVRVIKDVWADHLMLLSL